MISIWFLRHIVHRWCEFRMRGLIFRYLPLTRQGAPPKFSQIYLPFRPSLRDRVQPTIGLPPPDSDHAKCIGLGWIGYCRGIYQTIPVYGASVNINRTFSEGAQFVEYKVVDVAGNFARCSFYVTVRGSCSSSSSSIESSSSSVQSYSLGCMLEDERSRIPLASYKH